MTDNSKIPEDGAGSVENWVVEYGDELFAFALARVGVREIAEDLVQETLLAALKAKSKFAGRSSVKTWLVSILKNKVVDHFRKAWRTVSDEDQVSIDNEAKGLFQSGGRWQGVWKEEVGPRSWNSDPERQLEEREFNKALKKCLSELPASLSAIFVMREMDEFGSEEICKELDISSSNLWVSLHRARLRLRNCLERRWLGEDAGNKKQELKK